MSAQVIETSVGRLQVHDSGTESGARTAVLWHSLFVDARSWERVAPALGADRRLVVITGPGHGLSGDPGRRYTMNDCADAAVEILAELGVVGPVDWVGNAWGGHVGAVVAAQHPDLIATLCTVGTPVHAYPPAARRRTGLLVALYRRLGPRGFLVTAVSDALLSQRTRDTDPAAVAAVREAFTRADRARMANAIVSISLRRTDLTPLLPAIQAPTVFITGSDHPDWTPEQAQAAASLLPHGSSATVDGAAYLAPLESPDDFVDAVRRFWAAQAEWPASSPGARAE